MWTERLLGIDPQPPPPHAFALDAEELRYGGFSHGPHGVVYEASQTLPLPEGTFGDGLLGAPMREPRGLQDAVGDLVRRLPEPIREASLVLPDAWLRLTFTEIAELPRKRSAREEMLRWKLKRLVPFRVEDLRISATRVTPFPAQEEPLRLLIAFAIDKLMSQIEDAFSAAGVELGRITNTTLAVAASLDHAMGPGDLAGLVVVHPEAHTLSFYRGGEPLLYRYKAPGPAAPRPGAPGTAASAAPGPGAGWGVAEHRDLRLTTSFLRQHFPQTPISRVFLAAPPELEDQWLEWLYDELEVAPEPLAFEHFRVARTQVGPSWLQTAPLLGAASLEVA